MKKIVWAVLIAVGVLLDRLVTYGLRRRKRKKAEAEDD